MELFAVAIPGRRVFIVDVFEGGIEAVELIKAIDRFAEQFEVTMKEDLGEHELLVDRKALFDLRYLLKVVDQ